MIIYDKPPTYSGGVSPVASPGTQTIGNNVQFSSTAIEPESDSYYMIGCSVDSVTPGTGGGAPSCGGGGELRCVSSLTSTGVQATCNWDTTGQTPDVYTSYVFVCDNFDDAELPSSCSLSSTTYTTLEVPQTGEREALLRNCVISNSSLK